MTESTGQKIRVRNILDTRILSLFKIDSAINSPFGKKRTTVIIDLTLLRCAVFRILQ